MLFKDKKNGDLIKAEAMGNIKTMPNPDAHEPMLAPDVPAIIDNPDDFRSAVGYAQLSGEYSNIEVSERLFKHIIKSGQATSFTYGQPAVRVFLAGTKDAVLKQERMNIDEYNAHIISEKQKNANQ